MEDSAIVTLYWQRSEQAIAESDTKYGPYCGHIAYGLLQNSEDTQECVSDTWLAAWNAMPPHRPAVLRLFLGKLTRRLSLQRLRRQGRLKRGSAGAGGAGRLRSAGRRRPAGAGGPGADATFEPLSVRPACRPAAGVSGPVLVRRGGEGHRPPVRLFRE